MSPGRNRAAAVVALFPAGTPPDKLIDHHVPWPGIEGDDIFRPPARGQDCDIANSPDVQCDPMRPGAAKQQIVDERNQRGALPTPPPISRGRKFETTGIPRRSAITAGSPSCSVFRAEPFPS